MKRTIKISLSILMSFWFLSIVSSCQTQSIAFTDTVESTLPHSTSIEQTEAASQQFNLNNATDVQIKNLQKLCKVWGYTKYTHPAFLLGKKDWDEELLALILEVGSAESEENVNDILYQWFSGLGDIDYGTDYIDPTLANSPKENVYVEADFSWLSDTIYLGEPLSNAISQLKKIPTIERGHAPVMFESLEYKLPLFTNEKSYEDFNYADAKYRLLGLFRVWNVIEYYYPYLTLIDDDWDEMLSQHIVRMLERSDKQTFDLTLASLTSKIHDAHVAYGDTTCMDNEFGQYAAPVYLVLAEGKLVVGKVQEDYQDSCTPMPGDVLLELNGVTIEEVIENRKQYLSIPNDEKLLNALTPFLLRSTDEIMEITVLRNSIEIELDVQGTIGYFFPISLVKTEKSYELLDSNIGLINPNKLAVKEVDGIMDEFSGTDGVIIDLRQYPPGFTVEAFEKYLLSTPMLYAMLSCPSKTIPGVFLTYNSHYSGDNNEPVYNKPVVILMNELSQSAAELVIMGLRNGPNVVVIGQNSVGANGAVTYLSLPDGNLLRFTGLGVYTPDGNTYQRVGLSPDIYVERTVAGVREGRDEFIEAAVQYILDKNAEAQDE